MELTQGIKDLYTQTHILHPRSLQGLFGEHNKFVLYKKSKVEVKG